MDALATSDQVLLQQAARELFADTWSTELVRAKDQPLAERAAALLAALGAAGLFGVPLGAEHGGGGGSLLDLALIAEESGRALAPAAVLGTLTASAVVASLASGPDWIAGLAAGQVLIGVAERAEVRSHESAVTGQLGLVPDADALDRVIIVPRSSVSDGIFVIDVGSPGVGLRPRSAQGACRWYDVTLDAVPAQVLPVDPIRAGAIAVAVRSAAMAGGTQAVIDRTVTYIRQRELFGRTIAHFQAAQHHVADMHIRAEIARLTARHALWVADAAPDRLVASASIAAVHANSAYTFATLTAHQLHGGNGFLRESDLHLWSEHARVLALWGGPTDKHLRAVAG